MAQVFVPVIENGKTSLYRVYADASNDPWFVNGLTNTELKRKLKSCFEPDKNVEFGVINVYTKDFLGNITSNMQSVCLGLYLASFQHIHNREYRSWDTITVTGDINPHAGKIDLKSVGDIINKYGGVQVYANSHPDQNHLFLYIGDIELEMPNNGHIEVKAFTPRDPLIEVLNYLFEPCFEKGPVLLNCKEVNKIGYNYTRITETTMYWDYHCVNRAQCSGYIESETVGIESETGYIESEGEFKIWNLFDKYYAKDCSIYLVKDDKMVGYCSICPIEDDCFDNSLINGKEIIRPEMIAPYKPGGNPFSEKPYEPGKKFNVYITTISIEDENYEDYCMIFEWIFKHLEGWKKDGILKDRIGISVYSYMLQDIVERLGFLPKPKKNPIGGTVFECKLEELRDLMSIKNL